MSVASSREFHRRWGLAARVSVAPTLLVAASCTQDFGTFDPAGSGGSAPTSSSVGSPTSSTSSGTSDGGGPSATTTTTTTSVGTGGGEGGATTGTGGAGGGTGGSGGAPPTCELPTDCDDGEPCTTDSCVAGDCANAFLGDGTVEPGYVDDPLDCVTRVCDGGTGVEVDDEDDDPPDEACREVVCVGGEPTPGDPINEGDSCGDDPLVCESGVCVGCTTDGECPDPLAACLVGDCLPDSTCGEMRTTVDPPDTTAGDCSRPNCDGTSDDPILEEDATDEPNDGECGVGACDGMSPIQNPAPPGTACSSGGTVCNGMVAGDTACVVCTVDGGTTYGCEGVDPACDEAAAGGEGACVECLDDGDCTVGVCDTDARQCVECLDDGDCTGEVCDTLAQVCVECLDDLDCTDEVCDTDANVCVECLDDLDCTVGACDTTASVCVECVDDGDCTVGVCDTGPNVCVECLDSGDCAAGVCDTDINSCEACASNNANGSDLGCGNGLDPVCNETDRTCGGCADDDLNCTDNTRGHDCRAGGQCGCQNVNDCPIGTTCSGNVCG